MGAETATAEPPIVEREPDLAEVGAALDAAADGAGSLLVVEGPAGIGKTALLRAMKALAAERRFEVLHARGAHLERDVALGVALQLFEQPLRAADSPERKRLLGGAAAPAGAALGLDGSAPSSAPALTAPHALYWLTANIAERGPLVLLVDDAHWSDSASLRFLGYLARRIEGLCACLAVALRPDEPGADRDALAAFGADSFARVVQPDPLSEAGTGALLDQWLPGSAAAPEFSATCRRATGGNPLLVRELAASLAADGIEPGAAAAMRIGGLAPRTISRFVLMRIGNLDPGAARVASAAAVLGDRAQLRHVAKLAGLELDAAAAAADVLARVEVLERGRPLRFVHPIVRESVYADIPPGARAAAHADAAALLDGEDAPVDAVAAHLMATDAGANGWVVERLCAAATLAAERGAPETAARYLRRALEEPPAADARASVLARLGEMELMSGDGAAATEHLESSLAMSTPGPEHAHRAHLLARAALAGGNFEASLHRFEAAIAVSEKVAPERAREIEAEMASVSWQDARWAAPMMQRAPEWEKLAGDTRAELTLLACAARLAVRPERPAAEAAALARRAVAGTALVSGDRPASIAFGVGVYALMVADELDEVDRALARAEALASERGNVLGRLAVWVLRALASLRRGRIREAEADALAAIGATESTLLHPMAAPAMVAVLAEAQVESGRPDEAAATIARLGMDGEIPPTTSFSRLLHARALVRLAQDDPERSLADALAVGERDEPEGMLNPWVPWRITASIASRRLGRDADARRLAEEWLTLAEGLGIPSVTGQALRCVACVRPPPAGSSCSSARSSCSSRRPRAASWRSRSATSAPRCAARAAGRRRSTRCGAPTTSPSPAARSRCATGWPPSCARPARARWPGCTAAWRR